MLANVFNIYLFVCAGMAANQRDLFPKHNVVVSLDTGARGAEYNRQILKFLLRSRIRHALTHSPPLMIDYIRQFWATARYNLSSMAVSVSGHA